jgi:neutral ceramidase
MYLFEMYKNGNKSLPGAGPFVAAFSNSNEGDVTPNTRGAFCPDGNACSFQTSTCKGISQTCNGLGPGIDDFDSTRIIGKQQFTAGLNLYNLANIVIQGPIDYRHQWVNMENVTVSPTFTKLDQPVNTCTAALGDSFAAGTTDGPGDFDFRQGSNSTKYNPYWNLIGHLVADPPADQVKCHAPKPILLYTGGADEPAAWSPSTLPLQIFRLGQLFIVAVPAEFTTMSGRRLRSAVQKAIAPYVYNATVVIAGLANAYSQYVATPEEYEIQRYEGASTLFGPYTQPAYMQLYSEIATALVNGDDVPDGTPPVDWTDSMIDILPPVIDDLGTPGKVTQQPLSSYKSGLIVSVTFEAGNPRNNVSQSSFLYVERQNLDKSWSVVAVDGHWETKYIWSQESLLTSSRATILWDSTGTPPGTYRIRHVGTQRKDFINLSPYEGISNSFMITL